MHYFTRWQLWYPMYNHLVTKVVIGTLALILDFLTYFFFTGGQEIVKQGENKKRSGDESRSFLVNKNQLACSGADFLHIKDEIAGCNNLSVNAKPCKN